MFIQTARRIPRLRDATALLETTIVGAFAGFSRNLEEPISRNLFKSYFLIL